MSLLRTISGGLRSLFRKDQVSQELDEELNGFLEMAAEEKVKEGMSRNDALRAVRLERGSLEVAKEVVRSAGWESFVETCWQDLRFAVRMLRKSPGFTAVAVLTLALGIGANTAIFSVIEGVLLRPLPYPDPDRLYAVWAKSVEEGRDRIGASGPDIADYKEQNRSLELLTGLLGPFNYIWHNAPDGPRTVKVLAVSADFFPMFGVQPVLGRFYAPEEYGTDGGVIMISERFWKEQLGHDPNVIGRVLNFGPISPTVIGVIPSLPDLHPETDILQRLSLTPDYDPQQRRNKFFNVVGRLKVSVTPKQAEQELTAILRRAPGEHRDVAINLVPLKDDLVGDVRAQLRIVMAAVGLVLFIACANVAYLLLARAARRQPEVAVRLSMGASRWRMLQQFLTENLILVLLGGALGMAQAVGCTRLYTKLNLANLPRGHEIGVGGNVLIFALSVILLVSVLLACVSVAAFSKLDLNATLKMGRSETGGVGKLGFRALVVSEVSLAIVLLIAAGLLVRSYAVVAHVEPGFRPDHLLTTYFRTHYDIPGGERFFLNLSAKLSLVPGVQATGFASCTPGTWTPSGTLLFSDRPNDPNNAPTVAGCWISPDFFRAIGSRLLQGRTFTERDDASAPPVVIVNKALANSFWPGQNPVGKRIAVVSLWLGRQSASDPRFSEVVGVVEDIKQQSLEKPFEPNVYLSFLQDATNQIYRSMNMFVRTKSDPRLLAGTVRAQVHTEWPNQPIDSIETMQSVLFRTLAPRRLSLVLIGGFAALALFLSAIGIYGMIAYVVSLRTREFGLRLALGAQRQDVLRLVLSEGVRMAAVGVTAGVLASLLFSRFMQSLLFGVSSYDPLTFFAVAALLTSIALLACYIPARRAMRLDPMLALRYE